MTTRNDSTATDTENQRTEHASSFAPLVGTDAHTLILGSMPGQASLKQLRYYAHPRNGFWPIMLAIVNNTPASFEHASTMSYEERCQCLSANGYAVWDVLAHCYRPGSLDSNIVRNTEKANDIASLVQRHPNLHRIAFNGKTAQALFRRHVTLPKPYTLVSLPSSSPAMASLTLSQKHQRWAEGLLG